jgi:hypothetical protein
MTQPRENTSYRRSSSSRSSGSSSSSTSSRPDYSKEALPATQSSVRMQFMEHVFFK